MSFDLIKTYFYLENEDVVCETAPQVDLKKNQSKPQHSGVLHSSNAANKLVQTSVLWSEEICLLHTPPECPCKGFFCFVKVCQVNKHVVGKKMGPENLG